MEEVVTKRKLLDITNIIFATWIILIPFLCVAVGTFMYFGIGIQLKVFAITYSLYLLVRFIFSFGEIKFRDVVKKYLSFPAIWGVILFLCVVISIIIYGKLTGKAQLYLAFFPVYICFRLLDKKHFKYYLYVFTSVMMASVVMSLIFPCSPNIPGFDYNAIGGYSMQFFNPNYSAYVVATLLVVCIAFFHYSKKLFDKIFFSMAFVLFSWWLYCNGSFVPIATVYLFLFIMILFYWIKEKKIPLGLVIMFLALIPMSFAVDACPWWTMHRNASVNFIRECIAVFDNIFHTNVGGEAVPGADGWGRSRLLREAIKAIFANYHTFFLGYGAGAPTGIVPHVHLLMLWMDFGVLAPLVFLIMCIWTVVKYIKSKCEKVSLPFFFGLLAYFVMSFFGSMLFYTFTFIVPLFAICHSYIKHKPVDKVEPYIMSEEKPIQPNPQPEEDNSSNPQADPVEEPELEI